MGVRLIVEILDHWQDAELTPGERWDLLVLAENANDGSRLTFGPVHAPHILQRANKSPKGWKNAITALMRKKVITTHVPGRINQFAVYHLEHLCTEPPHSGYKGHCTKPEKGVDSVDTPAQAEGYPSANPPTQEGHLSDDPVPKEGHLADDPMGHPADDPLAREGHPADAERVIQQMTPTPLVSSFKDSPLSTPSSSVAEDPTEGSVGGTDGTDGGGGGNLPSGIEEITKQCERVDAFVDSLDYRSRRPGRQQRMKIGQRVTVAFKAGWTENGLRRYLDISDDPAVRSAAAVYLHRLSEDELPPAIEEVDLSPPCSWCRVAFPTAATDGSVRKTPLGDPCPECHPSVVQQTTELPPVCDVCVGQNPAAEFNIAFRRNYESFHGGPCPRCHPALVQVDGADGGMWERAAVRAAERSRTGDWKGAGQDERVAGWLQLGQQLGDGPKPMIAPPHQPYRDSEDQSIYDEPFYPEGR